MTGSSAATESGAKPLAADYLGRTTPLDHLRMVLPCADEPILGGNQPLEAVESKLKQAFSADKWDELFGKAGPAHRPKPRPGTTCNNQGVSHVEIFSLLKSSQIGARAQGKTGLGPAFELLT